MTSLITNPRFPLGPPRFDARRGHRAEVEARNRALRDAAWAIVQSVPYKVSLRFVFYPLLQNGTLHSKDDYSQLLEPVLSEARHLKLEGWRPDTLADESRHIQLGGEGIPDNDYWVTLIQMMSVDGRPDYWKHQECYLFVAFEAAAMAGQFGHYLPSFVPRAAFRGQDSIAHKDELQALFSRIWRRYHKPVLVLYFGDDDKAGWQIPQIVERDVRGWLGEWHKENLIWVRGGLNEGDGARLGIPENPDKPGTYQWEALTDTLAGELIASALWEHLDREGEKKAEEEGFKREVAWAEWWREHKPTADDLGLDEDQP